MRRLNFVSLAAQPEVRNAEVGSRHNAASHPEPHMWLQLSTQPLTPCLWGLQATEEAATYRDLGVMAGVLCLRRIAAIGSAELRIPEPDPDPTVRPQRHVSRRRRSKAYGYGTREVVSAAVAPWLLC